jgi:predicted alpha-1,6-mannanase (GH76 family)
VNAIAFFRRPDARAQFEYVQGMLLAIKEAVSKEKTRRAAHDAEVVRLVDEALGYMVDGRTLFSLNTLLELRAKL